ncbi:MAG: ABC transporter permease [Verrucomicrobiota bacterium]|jgi:phospholipid/cholesterol/gamma-HCH transport system permease protein
METPPTCPQSEFEADVQLGPGGIARVVFKGRLSMRTVVDCWNKLETKLRGAEVKELEVDVRGVGFCGGAGYALLRYLNMGRMTPGAKVSVVGLAADFQTIFQGFTARDYDAFHPRPLKSSHPLVEEAGHATRQLIDDLRDQLDFLGSVAANLPPSLVNPKRMRWPEVRHIFELAGANAVPIVSLVSLLLGFIIAFESAQRLADFGAQIYVANTITVVMVREMGPLMTAILLAGRSASAFAAEIGTMKVNEELNALETLGLSPVRFLVVPRIVAGVLVAPLLTCYSILMGVVGGALVMLGLGFSLMLILHQMALSVRLGDLAVGMEKSVVFGIIVSGVGCWRGLQTQQGPSAVGLSTTRAVVTSLLLIILADAFFSTISYFFKQ